MKPGSIETDTQSAPQMDLLAGKANRDAGMAKALENAVPFADRVREHFAATFVTGDEILGEDIRVSCVEAGIVPHHHNCWGAVVKRLIATGNLIPMKKQRQMRYATSNARATQVLYVFNPRGL